MTSIPGVPRHWMRLMAILVILTLILLVLRLLTGTIVPVARRVLDVLDPVLLAFAIAYVLDPVVDWFQHRGRSRTFGVVIVAGTAALLASAFVLFVIPAAIERATEIIPRVLDSLSALGDGLADRIGPRYGQGIQRIRRFLLDAIQNPDLETLGSSASLQAALSSGKSAALFVLDLVLVPVLAVYLLRDMDRIKSRSFELMPPRWQAATREPLLEVDRVLSGFVRGQLKVAIWLAVLYSAGLVMCGTPLGLAIGIFAGIVSVVPYLGVALGLVPALALNLVEHEDPWRAGGVIATFAIAQFLEAYVITPRLVGPSVGLPPVAILVALLLGGAFFGVAGMVLAVPVTAVLKVILMRLHARYALQVAEGPQPTESARPESPG